MPPAPTLAKNRGEKRNRDTDSRNDRSRSENAQQDTGDSDEQRRKDAEKCDADRPRNLPEVPGCSCGFFRHGGMD